jgi:hypothetical protein
MLKLIFFIIVLTLTTQNNSALENDILEFEMSILEEKLNEVNTLQTNGWKNYLDLVLKGEGVKAAGIYNKESGDTWEASTDFRMSKQEVKNMVAGIKE